MSELAQQIGEANQPTRKTAAQLVESMRGEFAKVLPETLPPDAFLRLALTELRTNQSLQKCSASSLLGALMNAARLGLEPGGPLGLYYLTPRNLKRDGWTVVGILGYKGMRALAYRSGLVRDMDAVLIRSGDFWDSGASTERGIWFDWKPKASEMETDEASRPVVAALAVATLTTGGVVHRRLDLRTILERKDRGSAGDSGPWSTDFEAMCRKTALRELAGALPMSSSTAAPLAVALATDEQVQSYRGPEQVTEPEQIEPAVTEEA